MGRVDTDAQAQLVRRLMEFEREYRLFAGACIAGVDEVGRGPLAGPVVACAVILPDGSVIPGVNDSKKLSPKKRETVSAIIEEKAAAIAFGVVSHKLIDSINIRQATLLAMKKAVESLKIPPDCVLIDGRDYIDIACRQVPIVAGDTKSISIASASVVAKVARDAMMARFHKLYPEYGFERNKGYGTKEHILAIKSHGLCPIHRHSFVRRIMGER